jgi:hypothetical protein
LDPVVVREPTKADAAIEEGIAARTCRRHVQRGVGHGVTGRVEGGAQFVSDVGGGDRAEVVAVGVAREHQDVVVE